MPATYREEVLLRALAGERTERTPIWLMRQPDETGTSTRVREAAGGMDGVCNSTSTMSR